jgi:hypothetical protein
MGDVWHSFWILCLSGHTWANWISPSPSLPSITALWLAQLSGARASSFGAWTPGAPSYGRQRYSPRALNRTLPRLSVYHCQGTAWQRSAAHDYGFDERFRHGSDFVWSFCFVCRAFAGVVTWAGIRSWDLASMECRVLA